MPQVLHENIGGRIVLTESNRLEFSYLGTFVTVPALVPAAAAFG